MLDVMYSMANDAANGARLAQTKDAEMLTGTTSRSELCNVLMSIADM